MSNMLQVLDQWMANFLEEIHTCIPGRVETYSGHAERRARVVPMVRQFLQNGELVEIKPIDDVPVLFPSSAGGALLMPLKAGDGVMLYFSEVGIGKFLHGKANVIADADDPSRFSLSDCVAIPGLWPFSAVPKLTEALDDRPWFGSAEGAFLAVKDKVKLANKSSDLRTELDALWDALKATQNLLKAWAPVSAAPGSPTVPVPAQVVLVEAEITKVATAKANLKKFLE